MPLTKENNSVASGEERCQGRALQISLSPSDRFLGSREHKTMENMMNKLQNLVAYPKINEDFYSRTLSGGVITLASSIVMLLLFSEGGGILTLAEIYQLLARKLSGKVFLEAANYQLKIDFVREYQAIERGTEGTRDKVGVEVKDLYARILVAICSAESISQRIRRLRDEELQPQLIELLKGFMRNWRIITCWNCMKLKTKSCLE
ncbi:uncharacterized protein LOC133735548 isoform X2 [Rosa rugosa]|uniref:uncharacterized protein LOC133735548 isoform X2 n=1 Tax=Rosa rugosa TaxID=74645 RepID=UPI002B409767|nr:uncharacterized protein LOC133735548 isoform X2 [Rosa rugosa]